MGLGLTASPEPTVWPTEGTKRPTMDGWSGGFSVASTPANNSNNLKDLGGGHNKWNIIGKKVLKSTGTY